MCRPGDEVVACVGPSRPFAFRRILDVRLTALTDIDPEYRAGVEAIYPKAASVWMLTFEVVESPTRRADSC
jgi:hypothetical protein